MGIKQNRTLACVSISAIALMIASQSAMAQDDNKPKNDTDNIIIVTGVFSAKSIENAPISISAVTQDEIDQLTPVSSADILKNVPGVFVNSSLGEIRNVVFSRGVSANSLDGSGGYYYVSLQEDGLPVEPVTATNFGPDYFARADIMLDHVEALRGGTATVTGTNAPGGIFNYVSRTGKSHPGYEVQGKFGLEGDGRSPYYRVDAYAGGEIGNDLYYAIGGFYRHSDGARNPGYALNRGGQVRANLLWNYDKGSLTLDAKYLDDHNGWFEFIPAFNYNDPKIAKGFTNYSSVLPPSNPHSYTNPDGTTGTWDGSNLVHSTALSFGMKWDHRLSDRINVRNLGRYTLNKSNWNTGAAIFPVTLDDFLANILLGTFGLPGTTVYRFHGTNTIAAEVSSATGFDKTVTVNNLPNQNVLQNGILTQLAFAATYRSRTFQDQFSVTADLDRHQLTAGIFYSHSKLTQQSGSAGFALSPLVSQPQLFDVTQILPDSTVLRVTDPAGFGNQGGGLFDGDGYGGTQEQFSAFAGDSWSATEALSVDLGVRYEHISYDIYNLSLSGGKGPVNGGAGYDNNPSTLWDNRRNLFGPTTYTKRSFSFWNFTGSINYRFSDQFQAYVRATRGEKAGDFGLIAAIDTPPEIATQFPKPQVIEQLEIGLKYRSPGVRIAVFPFYSKLSNVGDTQTFADANGKLYSPPTVFGQIKTYGVELDADADIGRTLNIRSAITVQRPKASGFGLWVHNTTTNDPADDVLVSTPPGDADNNPKLIARTTLTWTPVEGFSTFFTHSYTGKRAANRVNAWYMPGFSTFDLGASYKFAGHFKLQANISNLFNNFGVMSWARTGGFFNSLDRQGLSKADVQANPNQLLEVVPIQPRAFWLTATVSF